MLLVYSGYTIVTSFMCCPGVFTVDFGLVLHLPLVVSLLTLGRSLATMLKVYFCFCNSLIVCAIIS